jgi:hypothetical protein
MATSLERVMRGSARFASSLLLIVLAFCVSSLGAPCAAQEVDAPTVPDTADGRGSIVAPSSWVVLTTPVRKQIDLKLYGFYIGDLGAPCAQVDVPIRLKKFLTITPSYLFYSVPADGLDELANQPGAFSESYDEHQFRIDGNVMFAIGKLELSVRNMYVRRFRPAQAPDANRYRTRFGIAHPVAVKGRQWKAFAQYEAYYEHQNGGWNKNRAWTGVTVPVAKRVFVQPSYLWERSDGLKTIHYLLFGLLVSAK